MQDKSLKETKHVSSSEPVGFILLKIDFFTIFARTLPIFLRVFPNFKCLQRRISLRKKCPYLELFWSAFFPHFHAFGLNTERYGVSLRIQSEYKKIREECGPE